MFFFFLSRDTVKTALKVNILFIHGTKGRTYCGGGGGGGGCCGSRFLGTKAYSQLFYKFSQFGNWEVGKKILIKDTTIQYFVQ